MLLWVSQAPLLHAARLVSIDPTTKVEFVTVWWCSGLSLALEMHWKGRFMVTTVIPGSLCCSGLYISSCHETDINCPFCLSIWCRLHLFLCAHTVSDPMDLCSHLRSLGIAVPRRNQTTRVSACPQVPGMGFVQHNYSEGPVSLPCPTPWLWEQASSGTPEQHGAVC